jgi:Putative zinc-finger
MNANGIDCTEFTDLAPELALGILSGNERAVALGHLGSCAACREQLDHLAGVADHLLLLSPSKEPPIGFESRVLARLQSEGAAPAPPRRRRWAPTRRLLAIAAAAAILLGGVTGGLIGANQGSTRKQATVVSKVVWAGKSTCQMVVLAPIEKGGPTVVMIRMHEVGSDDDGPYPVFVEPVTGDESVQVGSVIVHNGVGMRGFPVPGPVGKIKAIVVQDSSSPKVLYRATFPAI